MTAVISACGRYRYRLERDGLAPHGLTFAYFGVNPSTADARRDDQTTLKWKGFTVRNGGRRYIAGNPFAWRATHVRELVSVVDPIGPDNAQALADIIAAADILVPCWGNLTKVTSGMRSTVWTLRRAIWESGKPVKVFGLTRDLEPKHPLMLPYSTPLVDWR